MRSRPRLFWDSCAIIDAIFALEASPYYDLLDLGETKVVDMRVSPDVIRECEAILRRHGGETVALLAAEFILWRKRHPVAKRASSFAVSPVRFSTELYDSYGYFDV